MSQCAMTREATLLVGCDSSVADCSDRTPPTRLRHCGELGQGTRHVNRNLGFCFSQWEDGDEKRMEEERERDEINQADAFLWTPWTRVRFFS